MAPTNGEPRTDGTPDTRTVPELFRELAGETATLLRQEVELVRAELTAKTEEAKLAAFAALSGLALFFSGVIIVLLGLVYGLSESIPLWIAALIIGVIASTAGAIMLRVIENSPLEIAPKKTASSVRESAQAIGKSIRETPRDAKEQLS